MYHPEIVAENVRKMERKLSRELRRYSVKEVEEWVRRLDSIVDLSKGKLKRQLDVEERSFIENETILYKLDYRYGAERYHHIQLDGGGVGRINFWGSQEMLLKLIAEIQWEMYQRKKEGKTVDGILIAAHKARQLGLTAVVRSIIIHRATSTRYTRSMAASIDDEKVMELYDRDKIIISNLPWWLSVGLEYDVKGQHIAFERLGTRILYQASKQTSGVGQGRQFDTSHLTEVASWEETKVFTIENDFFPTIPQSMASFSVLETTAQGRGNWWHDFVTLLQEGQSPRWKLLFIPWYAEPRKYRRTPPDDWKPSEMAMSHAQKVWETSEKYIGKQVMLGREQLYWYESTREEHRKKHTLNLFLTNYCATVEESFQHTTSSAFSPELLERLRLQTSMPEMHEVFLQGRPRDGVEGR